MVAVTPHSFSPKQPHQCRVSFSCSVSPTHLISHSAYTPASQHSCAVLGIVHCVTMVSPLHTHTCTITVTIILIHGVTYSHTDCQFLQTSGHLICCSHTPSIIHHRECHSFCFGHTQHHTIAGSLTQVEHQNPTQYPTGSHCWLSIFFHNHLPWDGPSHTENVLPQPLSHTCRDSHAVRMSFTVPLLYLQISHTQRTSQLLSHT